MLYVSAGVGLGGGMVMDGRGLSGAAGFAGEFGHMTIDPNGPLCNCGNRGCWETLASQAAVFRRVRAALQSGRTSCLTHLTHGNLDKLTIPLIIEAAREADPVALEALQETGIYLGIGLANLINALNPEMVVFGGILSRASAYLLPIIERAVEERTLFWSRRAVQLVVAAHGSDACVMGGIATVYQHILSQPKAIHRMARARAGTRVYPQVAAKL
jgi:predicted NBD/HSP70 family sugar kinase